VKEAGVTSTDSRSGAAIAGTGIVLTMPMVVANFRYLPYQPVWSTIVIALGVFVIWSLFHNVGPEAS
jgi:hypothetical protein